MVYDKDTFPGFVYFKGAGRDSAFAHTWRCTFPNRHEVWICANEETDGSYSKFEIVHYFMRNYAKHPLMPRNCDLSLDEHDGFTRDEILVMIDTVKSIPDAGTWLNEFINRAIQAAWDNG